ncbi:hypothetical protein DPMN_038526 [Dreissena polymorpha]|uniref:Uncharacterized protein n=1 Tax=Dreissena polymorpha TaxID=45954 RepID=A0A9D4RQC5_DREPO|nr:hypothetical protein DPMN_038526 [Dreissena polymorpha]
MWKGTQRVELELLLLKYINRVAQIMDESGVAICSDIMLQKILMRQCEIATEFLHWMNSEGGQADSLHDILMSM